MRRPTNLDDPQIVLATRIPLSLRKKLGEYTDTHDISIADAVRQAIEAMVAKEGKK